MRVHKVAALAEEKGFSRPVELVAQTLRDTNGNIQQAKATLDLSERGMRHWLKKLRITRHVSVEVEIIEAQ